MLAKIEGYNPLLEDLYSDPFTDGILYFSLKQRHKIFKSFFKNRKEILEELSSEDNVNIPFILEFLYSKIDKDLKLLLSKDVFFYIILNEKTFFCDFFENDKLLELFS